MLDDESVHLTCTSPPYWGLRDYKAPAVVWGPNDCEHEWGAEKLITCGNNPSEKNTLRDGRENIARTGEKYGPAENTKASTGQFCARCGAWRGQLGLEPTPELYVEHLVEIFREVKRVLRKDGTLWLNLGDSYATQSGTYGGDKKYMGLHGGAVGDTCGFKQTRPRNLKHKDLCGIPWRVALALQADGWYLRSDIIWAKPNPMPESVTDRPTTSHEHIFLLTKSPKYFYDADAVREPFNYPEREYNPDTSKHKTAKLKEQGNRCTSGLHDGRTHYGDPERGRNLRSVWTITTRGYPEAHFATFPPELPATCIKTSPTKVCKECGAGWERVVEKEGERKYTEEGNPQGLERTKMKWGDSHPNYNPRWFNTNKTLGFRPTCDCDGETGRAIILDPFGGRGTTALVALSLGRKFIHIDIGYPELAQTTLGLYCPEIEYANKVRA